MRKSCVSVILGVALSVLALVLTGCSSYEQPGETEAEGRIRHLRNARIQKQQLMEDVDYLLHTDEPSRLNNNRLPARR